MSAEGAAVQSDAAAPEVAADVAELNAVAPKDAAGVKFCGGIDQPPPPASAAAAMGDKNDGTIAAGGENDISDGEDEGGGGGGGLMRQGTRMWSSATWSIEQKQE